MSAVFDHSVIARCQLHKLRDVESKLPQALANGLLRGLLLASVTVDHFHAIKLGNEAVNDARRRVQQATLHRRGHRDDPLDATRRLMTRAWERLTERQSDKLFTALRQGDPDGEIGAVILGKELLREMYAAEDLEAAKSALGAFYAHRSGPRSPSSADSRRPCAPGRPRSSPSPRPERLPDRSKRRT